MNAWTNPRAAVSYFLKPVANKRKPRPQPVLELPARRRQFGSPFSPLRKIAQRFFCFLLLTTLVPATLAQICASCGQTIGALTIYTVYDEVRQEKVFVCPRCEEEMPDCFVCGLPAYTNAPGFLVLPDGRVLCARDARTAVLTEQQGLDLYHEVQDNLNRLFSRFLQLPDNNISFEMVDRVHIQELFKTAGNDYSCPNVMGFTLSERKNGALRHRISLMSGLPTQWFQATCAHELGHAWVAQNVPPARRKAFERSTEEGFCELTSYLLMDSLHDEAGKAHILRNAYTRGQVQLFLAAEQKFGFNDVLDWMFYGTDDRLSADDPDRIHNVQMPRPGHGAGPIAATPIYPILRAGPATEPSVLVVQAIFWDSRRPSAIINGRTFGPGEEGRVLVGTNHVVVRCLAIQEDRVRIRDTTGGKEQELILGSHDRNH